MDLILPLIVIFLAVFTQSLSGFGIALVPMAKLPGLLGIKVATTLVALVAITLETTLLIRYHASLNLCAIRPLVMATVVGIPIGVIALRKVDEELAMTVLGIVIAGYALYALTNLKIPELRRPFWAYLAGLSLDKFLDPAVFRKVVLVLLIILGVRLML